MIPATVIGTSPRPAASSSATTSHPRLSAYNCRQWRSPSGLFLVSSLCPLHANPRMTLPCSPTTRSGRGGPTSAPSRGVLTIPSRRPRESVTIDHTGAVVPSDKAHVPRQDGNPRGILYTSLSRLSLARTADDASVALRDPEPHPARRERQPWFGQHTPASLTSSGASWPWRPPPTPGRVPAPQDRASTSTRSDRNPGGHRDDQNPALRPNPRQPCGARTPVPPVPSPPGRTHTEPE